MIPTLREYFLIILLLLAVIGTIYLHFGSVLKQFTERSVAKMQRMR